eukprot:788811-Rhodomonas_salina.3
MPTLYAYALHGTDRRYMPTRCTVLTSHMPHTPSAAREGRGTGVSAQPHPASQPRGRRYRRQNCPRARYAVQTPWLAYLPMRPIGRECGTDGTRAYALVPGRYGRPV